MLRFARYIVVVWALGAIAGCPAPEAPAPGVDAGPLDAPGSDTARADARDDTGAVDAPAVDVPMADVPGACADPDVDGDGADSMACGGLDCDDADPARAPGLPEICDAADVDEDCDATTFGSRDGDADTHVDAACCNDDGAGGSNCGDDCDDSRADVFSGTTETCDGRDNDCDTAVDESVMQSAYVDADGDGHGDPATLMTIGCSVPMGFVLVGGDCDDGRADRNPGTAETCDDADNDCDMLIDEGVGQTFFTDADGDGFGNAAGPTTRDCAAPPGFAALSTDCDDTRASVNPATTELCSDGLDNNCNGAIDESGPRLFFRDADGDGFGDPGDTVMLTSCTAPANYAGNSRDCDDGRALSFPGGTEECNGFDDDCSLGLPGRGLDPNEDRDGDLHAPSAAACTGGPFPRDDCDDANRFVFPGASETCDRIDENCSSGGGLDTAEDFDGDLHAAPSAACFGGFPKNDCLDTDARVYTGAIEVCDRLDFNCSISGGDEPLEDADGDMHAPVGAACAGGYPRDDCNDASAVVYAGAPELCDRIDGDCGTGGGVEPSEDVDDDGHAPIGITTCAGGPRPADDCVDTNATIHPGAAELCDRLDDNCSSGGGVEPADDVDGDMHAGIAAACAGGPLPKDDCVDTNATIYAGAPEFCDRLDNACAFGGGVAAQEDADGDLHAAIDATCSGGPFPRDDCQPARPETYPGAPELCDRIDTDCTLGGGEERDEDFDLDGHAPIGATCTTGAAPLFPIDDCDDRNPATYPGAAAGTPAPAAPLVGAFSGSHLAPSVRNTLRPLFVWRGAGSCGHTFDLQVDDSCAVPGFASCAFPSPEVSVTDLSVTSYRPATALPVTLPSAGVAAGTRYFWRVRECDGVTCSAWSVVRYLFVGRVPSDLNGDGYSDLAVGAIQYDGPEADEGAVFVYHGSAAGPPSAPSVSLDNPTDQAGGSFGRGLTTADDLSGDGFADLCTGAFHQDAPETDEGVAFVYLGSSTGIAATPTISAESPDAPDEPGASYGGTLASADFNFDGFADLAVGAPRHDATQPDEGLVYVYLGGGMILPPPVSATINVPGGLTDANVGFSLVTLDRTGDGYADLGIGAPNAAGTGPGTVYTYAGDASAAGINTVLPAFLPVNGREAEADLGLAAAACDINADGYSDLAFGAPAAGIDRGYVLTIYGSPPFVRPPVADTLIDRPDAEPDPHFGQSVACGDLDGDGFDDLVVGAPEWGTSFQGRIYVYRGGVAGLSVPPSLTIYNPGGSPVTGSFGSDLSARSDIDGDGYVDLIVGAATQSMGAFLEGGVLIFRGGPGGISPVPSWVIDSPTNQPDSLFGLDVAFARPPRRDFVPDALRIASLAAGALAPGALAFRGHALR